ncbi:MAG TPA: hypothetical protein VLZ75_10655 [Chitinophagales bacterium]|nr:hypothetical protein [Chitinophagales bacterium]
MKIIKTFIVLSILILGIGCSKETLIIPKEILETPKEETETPKEELESIKGEIEIPNDSADSINAKKIMGTWVETYPELFDGKSDTIVFKDDFTIEKHLFYDGWEYSISKDTIFFFNTERNLKFRHFYFIENEHEMMIYNFMQSTVNHLEKNTPFTKISN